MDEVKKYLDEAEEKMEMASMHLEESLSRIRAGKANIHILDGVRVDSYGSMVPLSNVASLTTPDARSIAIKPWDKNMIKDIEKAILASDVKLVHLIKKELTEVKKLFDGKRRTQIISADAVEAEIRKDIGSQRTPRRNRKTEEMHQERCA